MNKKLEEILTSKFVVKEILANLDYLIELIPEIKMMISFDQKHPHHHLDLFEHTLTTLSLSPNNYELRLTLLLHDIAKPYCYKEGNVRHYYNHATISSEIAKNILTRLGYDKSFTNEVCKMIKYHDTNLLNIEDKKFLNKMYIIQYCDTYAHNPKYLDKRINYLKKLEKKIGGSNAKKKIK